MMTVGAKIQTNHLPIIAANLKPRVEVVQRKIAADMAGRAAQRTTRVDTGSMRAGYIFQRVADLEWIVYNIMHYQIYHELGTVHISALPMLIPAAESLRAAYAEAVAQIIASGLS